MKISFLIGSIFVGRQQLMQNYLRREDFSGEKQQNALCAW